MSCPDSTAGNPCPACKPASRVLAPYDSQAWIVSSPSRRTRRNACEPASQDFGRRRPCSRRYDTPVNLTLPIVSYSVTAGEGRVGAFIVGDPYQAIYGSLGVYAITAAEFGAMAQIDLKEMDLSRNYRSSERIVGYFGHFNVYETEITANGEHKEYPSLISFDPATMRDDLEAELVRLVRYNIETLGIAPREICILAPQWVHLASMTRRLVAALP